MLERRFGSRAWRWALGAPVLLYAFQNWDVFAIAALVVGLLAFELGHDRVAGAAFGLGAAVKLFPVVVVPRSSPSACARAIGEARLGSAAPAMAIFLVTNLPVFAASPSGLVVAVRVPVAAGTRRGASAWFYALPRSCTCRCTERRGAQLANRRGAGRDGRRARRGWSFVTFKRADRPVRRRAAAAVAIFVLCNKVYSPTYDVWFVAFFVMLPTQSTTVGHVLRRRPRGVRDRLRLLPVGCRLACEVRAATVLPVLVVARTVVLRSSVGARTRLCRCASAPDHARPAVPQPSRST